MIHPASGNDIVVLDQERHEIRPFLNSDRNEDQGVFSPDGKWLAYVSDESGRREIYARAYPGPGGRYPVSNDGGDEPVWARNGEIFYRDGVKMMSVFVQTSPTFRIVRRILLFELELPRMVTGRRTARYDVFPDGQRFLMIQGEKRSLPTQVNIVLNWFEELKRLVPSGK